MRTTTPMTTYLGSFFLSLTILICTVGCATSDNSFSWGITDATVDFAGHKWYIKDSDQPLQPGPCFWTSKNVLLKGDELHLSVAHGDSGSWMSSEVMIDTSFGYGHYEIAVESALADHNENVVFKVFIWDETNSLYNEEIDLIEASRFGDPFNPFNAQFVVAPWNLDHRINRFAILSTCTSSIITLDWPKTQLFFSIFCPDTGFVSSWQPEDISIIPIPSGNERLHLNAWQNFGNGPTDDSPVTFIVSSFSFSHANTNTPAKNSTALVTNSTRSHSAIAPGPLFSQVSSNNTTTPTPTPYWYYPGRIDPPTPALNSNSTNPLLASSPSTSSPESSTETPTPTPYHWWPNRVDPPPTGPQAAPTQEPPATQPVPEALPPSSLAPKQVFPSLTTITGSGSSLRFLSTGFVFTGVLFGLIGTII
jgi:hypothetical protein